MTNSIRNISFHMNQKESLAAIKFAKKHVHTNKQNIKYEFTPTGVGNHILIVCNICTKEKDISDYGSW